MKLDFNYTYPSRVCWLLFIAVLDERLQVKTVTYVALDCHILAVGHNVGELTQLDLIDNRWTVVYIHNLDAISHVKKRILARARRGILNEKSEEKSRGLA